MKLANVDFEASRLPAPHGSLEGTVVLVKDFWGTAQVLCDGRYWLKRGVACDRTRAYSWKFENPYEYYSNWKTDAVPVTDGIPQGVALEFDTEDDHVACSIDCLSPTIRDVWSSHNHPRTVRAGRIGRWRLVGLTPSDFEDTGDPEDTEKSPEPEESPKLPGTREEAVYRTLDWVLEEADRLADELLLEDLDGWKAFSKLKSRVRKVRDQLGGGVDV